MRSYLPVPVRLLSSRHSAKSPVKTMPNADSLIRPIPRQSEWSILFFHGCNSLHVRFFLQIQVS
jgi:hypothetical protein